MRNPCAWCQSDLSPAPPTRQAEEAAIHGICASCLADLEREQGTQILALVDGLPHPALAVDGDLRIRAANQPACDLLGTPWASLVGRRLVEIFGCGQPRHRGACEAGIPCAGCELARLVQGTFRSGRAGFAAIPGPGLGRSRHPVRPAQRISTLRAGGMVTLRLDPLADPPRELNWLPIVQAAPAG